MNNIRKFILLGILLVISIGAVSASDISDDCQQTAAQLDNQDSTIESNPIVGQSVHIENADKNLKEASNKEIIVSQKRGDDISGSGTSDKPYKTINKAINSASSNDKIIISDDKYTLTAIDEGKVIYNNITITSNGKTILTNVNNVAGDKHIFQIGSGFTVLFSNLIFENVKDKSIITNHGSVTIKNCTFKNSKVSLNTDEYKAIVNNYQKMTVDGCSFTNINGNYGSALFNRGTLTVYNTNFTGNTASKNGGAIYNELNNITITNCILNNNEAKKSLQNTQPVGGAIYNNGNLAIRNSTLSNNEASTGGAVYNNKQLNAINSTFRQNNADCAGAIINLQRATINGCEFNNNYAEGHGIVILNIANYNNQKNQPQLALSNSLITNNNYIEDSMIANSYIATITDCLITNNSCGEGMIFNNATLKITGTKTYNNEVLGWGGIIQNEGNLTATNNLFMNTTGAFNGGVICIYHGDTSIISTNVFDSNEANEFDGMGGCISVKDSKNTTIRLNTFKNNRAFEGGAIYSDTTSIDICYNKFINNRAEYVGSAISNYGDNFKIRYNNFTANVVSNDGTNLNNYGSKVTVTGNVNYNGKKYPSTVENVGDKGQIIYNRFEDTIKAVTTTTTVSALSGVVGDRITLTATVKDNTGTAVEGGRVIFKLNGVTLKDNGKLSGSSNPLKVYVSNGIATTTIIADLSMKSISQISASYIGTTLYEKSNSNTAKAQIKLRSARIV
ncbi:MAG: hypothetical protein Q4Q22_03360, partial [Methanosphaera sp.]|nr:hypothetical protein [Methanosphaera sp.]